MTSWLNRVFSKASPVGAAGPRAVLAQMRPELLRADGNVHETEIHQALRVTRFEGEAPVAGRLVVLGFVNRSGSNLLGEYLRSVPGLHGFHESLNHDVVLKRCERKRLDSFPDYVQTLIRAAGAEALGVKASGAQLEMLHKWRILQMFRSVQGVHIVRQDIVAQAVSHWIALHTRQWHSRQEQVLSEQEVPFDPVEITRISETISLKNARIATAFSALGIPWTTVVYERLLEEPGSEVERLGAFLGVDLTDWTLPTRLKIDRQTSATKDAFVAKVREYLATGC